MTWRIDSQRASLARDPLQATIQLACPMQGLSDLRYRGDRLDGYWAGATIADAERSAGRPTSFAIEDAYVRGDDLIVVYEPTPELPYRWQVYWRYVAAESPQLATIDLILSVQTPRLDTRPLFMVGSETPANGVDWIDAEGQLVSATRDRVDRPAGATGLAALLRLNDNLTLVEMVEPEDFDACRLVPTEGAPTQTEWRLGETFMEKGVIRRIQFRTALLPTDAAQAATPQLLQQWLSKGPPLTA